MKGVHARHSTNKKDKEKKEDVSATAGTQSLDIPRGLKSPILSEDDEDLNANHLQPTSPLPNTPQTPGAGKSYATSAKGWSTMLDGELKSLSC
jgi:hypothetical protein